MVCFKFWSKIMEFKLICLCCFTVVLAQTTTDSPVTVEPKDFEDKFNPNEGLPEMEVHLPDPVDNVLSQHGYAYLMKYGYLPQSLLETGELRNIVEARNAIKTFQKFVDVPVSGELDTMTLAMMEKRRCGMPDIQPEERISHYRAKRYSNSKPGSGWNRRRLSYRIMNYTPDIEFRRTRKEIESAFKLWSEKTPIEFNEVYHGDADIMIHFAKKYHSDGFVFDGKGPVLVHAFYPGPGRGGDIHLDDDEIWTVDVGSNDVNLFSVVSHAIGHSLGLGHSSNPGSLMYPLYKDFHHNISLPSEDLNQIQDLYKDLKETDEDLDSIPTETSYKVVTAKPGDTPKMCHTTYDCVTMINKEMFLFKDKWFWRVSSNGDVQHTSTLISRFFYGMYNSVDAAFQSPKYGHIIFFNGRNYWIFENNYLQRDFPQDGRPITELGLPHDIAKVDAAFVWGYNKRVYFVSGSMYWKFNEEGRKVDYGYPKDLSIWQGVPPSIDAVFVDWNRITHFYKDNKYYTFEDSIMRVKEGFPKSTAVAWMGCAPPKKEKSHSSSRTNTLDISISIALLFNYLLAFLISL